MKKLSELWFSLLKVTAIACLALMVVLVFGNVVLRYIFNSGITVAEEASRLLFIYITFLGAAIALREHMHLGIDSVVARLSAKSRRICLVLSQCMMLYVTWLLLIGSWEQASINLATLTPVLGLSMALVYGVGVLFSLTSGGLLLCGLLRAVSGKMDDREVSRAVGTQPTEESVSAPASSMTA